MKNFKLYKLIATAIMFVAFNLIVLLCRDNFTKVFWIAFIMADFSIILYGIVSFLQKDKIDGEKGIYPVSFVMGVFLIMSLLLSCVYFAIPNIDNILFVVIPYIILFALFGIIVVFASMNKAVIQTNNEIKIFVMNKAQAIDALEKGRAMVNDEFVSSEISKIIVRITVCEQEDQLEKVFEYIKFIYKNCVRSELENIHNNIKRVNVLLDEIK